MRRLRFYCAKIEPQCVLDEIESHHLSRVLRLEMGSQVELFDGRGTFAEGIVQKADKRQAVIRTTHVTQVPRPESGRLILAVSYAKGQRFDWLVEKCTELGVDHIAAVQYDRTVKLGGSENATERLNKIALSAVKQCGRLFLPELSGPKRLQQSVNDLKSRYQDAYCCFGDPNGISPASFLVKVKDRDIVVLVGPEGGFSPEELNWMSSEKMEQVSIHTNILRVETAAAAFCAVIKAAQL
jgi:16S rRNA (uracil1498-N3)-methyltransferase